MNNVLLRIKELRDTFTPSEKTIADYIVNNIKEACDMTIRDLAVKTNSSPSSLVRFCRKLGFDGYQDFNKCLLYNAASIAQEKLTIVDKAINLDDSPKSIIQKITAYNIQSLEETINFIDVDTISFCADLIKKAKKILIFGLGFSYLTAKEAVEKSKELMTGNRAKLFWLELSFIGWAILAAVTFGIGYLWLLPYIQFATIAFYKFVSGDNSNVEAKVVTENNGNPIQGE